MQGSGRETWKKYKVKNPRYRWKDNIKMDLGECDRKLWLRSVWLTFPWNYLLLFCIMTNKCTQLFHKLSHCYMFRHYRPILRRLVINTLPSYTNICWYYN
jgi:hypothetical protein